MKQIQRRKLLENGVTKTLKLPLINSYGFGANSLEVVQQDITLNESSSTNKAITVVQISDLHLRSFEDIHEKIIKEVDRINPDLLFITGDIINESKALRLIYDFVSQLKTPTGKYSILGNWDYWSLAGINNIRREYERADCRLLINEKVDISLNSTNISLIGVDDFMLGKPDLAWYENDPLQASYKILLSHCPGYRDQITIEAFDLMISVHTHAAIFWRPLIWLLSGKLDFLGLLFEPEIMFKIIYIVSRHIIISIYTIDNNLYQNHQNITTFNFPIFG